MKKNYLFTDRMEAGPVAQRIRARGYEPRCRGFESLLAHTQSASKFIYCRLFIRMISYLFVRYDIKYGISYQD